MINSSLGPSHYHFETEQTLVTDENEPEDDSNDNAYQYLDDEDDDDTTDTEEDDDNAGKQDTETEASSSSFSTPTKKPKKYFSLDQKRRAVEYWESGKKQCLPVSTVRRNFRFVTSKRQLYRFKKAIEEAGSRNEKLSIIAAHTLNRFHAAEEKKLTVHDDDLRRWAMEKQREINVEGFIASRSWLWRLKNRHRIVSRKITKFVTQSTVKEGKIKIDETAKSFVKSCESYFKDNMLSQIFNTDQSGFELELHSGRTLATAGAKAIERVVQSIPSTTHSYTIQPTISANGELLSPLFIVLQEVDGQFGPRVKEHLFKAANLYVTASRSGNLTKDHLVEWFQNVYFKNTPDSSTLLIDSWTSYNDQVAIQNVKPANKTIKILRIPPKTTSLIQPLDVFFFRNWKTFVRKISDRVLLDDLDVNLHLRNSILKLQSLVHNQFSSPRFRDFIKYSWFKSGYLTDRPDRFQTPVEYCFDLKNNLCVAEGSECFEGALIICAWCKDYLCFNHFFNEFHYCNAFSP